MTPLSERAHAKINLYLHVVGKRADGYHLLDSLAVFAGAHDRLEAAGPGPAPSLSLEGRFGAALLGEDPSGNLVTRAVRALLDQEDGPALRLIKSLPIASGIGGGSADAAAALRLLLALRPDRDPGRDRLHAIATGLGADVPVCLEQKPARMRGVGEILDPAPVLPPVFMVLVNCGRAVSTPAVFRARAAGFTPEAVLPPRWLDARAMAADLAALRNDLEEPAIALCPEIRVVLDAIAAEPGCLLARMSGSGATCFGLFATLAEAERAAGALSRPGWWVWGGPLAPGAGDPQMPVAATALNAV
ncbi:4-(cytidine 5'-diphospho)-2-C-methyl-D-erythritol kinase [Acetobacteraceae bacterium KSS8]|uniref:4-diphosphocytidyl-2-C-methyl-D-erythritol kinase n=1 Tax=Endosaccharibacter trunci TaxID=2812733 RepID=A0ABT1WA86_9PROT|nr:4-(cytidine 5'-diphospho)-2-C-methyl-D-erythritol kinase [Acetobacteraceae bacterium KSS8]